MSDHNQGLVFLLEVSMARQIGKLRQLPTEFVLALLMASVAARDFPWSRSVFEDAVSKARTISLSYPNVNIRAFGISFGSRSWGQKVFDFFSVHVSSRLPVKP